ncbi:uncharacterized protein TNCV_2689791 [Trichonephila clavipes]|uniref:Uncharacterized protein n=1 Tax=Trichonephila clavipes TaxID=2585209 RepID=A0A8X6VY97_TRICX|nr:uncharacterized protein TNCV_2689791 [Trichonephila clavipes]
MIDLNDLHDEVHRFGTYSLDSKPVDEKFLLSLTQSFANKIPPEHAEVPQHDVAWIRIVSEVVLEKSVPGATLLHVWTGCRSVQLKSPKFVGMHNGHEWVKLIRQDAYVPVRVVSRRIRDLVSRQLHTTPYHRRASTSLNIPLLTCRAHGFMRMSLYPYTSINSNQLETKLVRPGNVFPVINSPMSVLTAPGEA